MPLFFTINNLQKMKFYIQFYNESKSNFEFDRNILGEISFKIFYKSKGFDILETLIENHTDLIECIKIFDDEGKLYTIDQFLSKISKLTIYKYNKN